MATKRKTLYEKPSVKFMDRLAEREARKLLGWEEEGKSSFGDSFLMKDSNKKKVRCTNNVRNRPLYSSNIAKIKQEILRGRWCFNGETRIIGETGLILNGQHTLIALVLAVQEYSADPEAFPAWKEEPTISTAIVFGVSEDDTTVNTMDTCKPRSLGDIYYRSELLKGIAEKDRRVLSRTLEFAVKHLWFRTGFVDAFNPNIRDTHAELVAFGARHPRILEAAKHIEDENGSEGKVSRFLRNGYATAMLYLMGSSATDPQRYREDQSEEHLDWSNWSKACDFFVLLAGDADEMRPVREYLGKLIDDQTDSLAVRTSVLVMAWNLYAKDKTITTKSLQLKFIEREPGWPELAEIPDVGGIDLGDAAKNEDFQSERIAKEAKTIKEEKAAVEPKKTTPKKKKPTTEVKKLIGSMRWVVNGVDEPWRGKVIAVKGKSADLKVGQGFKGAGNTKPVALAHLRLRQPAT